MNRKEIEKITYNITKEIIRNTDLDLVDIEYVKEGQYNYLRIYIDKPNGITLEDCSNLNTKLSKKLDEVDPIEEHYFLEVSSPGINRPFKTEEDYEKNINNYVEISLYKAIEGNKKYTGLLIEKDETSLVIKTNNKIIKINRDNISKINKAVIIGEEGENYE